ncbi:LegC family aminotransferase [Spiribacter sp. 221]|uniref:LegC family aminotransferase n=1 Tax=Spiribacter onubensis TaxID=3122420 RepID=UPI00349F5AEC
MAAFSTAGRCPSTADPVIGFVRALYGEGSIPLHRPVMAEREKARLLECIDSNFVSSAGAMVGEFERRVAEFTGARHVIAVVNGTAALHIALELAGVEPGDRVITQPLAFVASANAISYTGAEPVFLDIDADTLGLSPQALSDYLDTATRLDRYGVCRDRETGQRIAACLPVHTYGHPARIAAIAERCRAAGIALVEDAAEALGSSFNARHAGTFGAMGVLSFNGNKIITTGGGGAVLTNDGALAARARHLTTTAKVTHPWLLAHDARGYNYRMPSINAALGCAQMDRLPAILEAKRRLAGAYAEFFEHRAEVFVQERLGEYANFWLNAILLADETERDELLAATNESAVMTRPAWQLLNELPMYAHCQHDGLATARAIQSRLIALPSSVPAGWLESAEA